MPEALVTGGGRGIGENIARALAKDGYHVTVTGRTRDQVESVAAAIGGRALVGDVSKRDDVDRWASEVGELDVLICNAGTSGPADALADPDEWWRTFEVNVLGVYLCCHAFAPRMVERGSGRIVNVASGAAYLPATGGSSTAYGPTKAAVHRFSELLAATARAEERVRLLDQPGPRAHRDDEQLPGRPAVDAARVRAGARARARLRRVRRARRPLPARGARPAGEAARTDRRDPRPTT